MKRTVVMFDVDGVLANFIEGFRRLYLQVHGREFPLQFPDIRWDDLWDKEVWSVIRESRVFWSSLDPIPGGQVFRDIEMLHAGVDLYFVTARPGRDVKYQTEIWLGRQGVLYPTVVLSSRKGEMAAALGADYSIEDKAGNAAYISYQSPGTRSYLVDRPYNQFDPEMLGKRVRRVKDIEEFLADIKEGR